jgi:trehalose 6-phosphate synthase/phosphatase
MERRLLIVSNRLPVTVRMDEGRRVVRRSVGGLASGLRGPHERSGGLWVGWPGTPGRVDPTGGSEVRAALEALRLVPLALDAREVSIFYEHIANGVLWPVFHDRVDRVPLSVHGWDVYESVNARFADAVAECHRPGDLVWVHDYHLMRLPALLRERIPDASIGFFLHIPFPNPEIFFTLPTRAWLVEGLMGADLIGFHTRRYHGHFRAALRRLHGLEADAADEVPWRGRSVRLGVFPMGVDAAELARQAVVPEVEAKVGEYREPGRSLLVGVDRLDYSKGISRRLLAIERLLETRPEWRERVRLVQVAVPSRDEVGAYRDVRREVDGLVGRINGRFGTPSWMPIHYLYRAVPPSTLLGLYRAADVMVVTPVRDGMNLVAKEFVTTRTDEGGVLVLSEFAGAADTLTQALIVNPYDLDGTAAALHEALVMPPEERAARMRALRAHVLAHDVHRWGADFLGSLATASAPR